MKRPAQMFMLATLFVGTAMIVATIVPVAQARKSAVVESGNIAFVDVFTLVDRALVADEMAKARTDFSDKSTQTIGDLQQQIQVLQTQLQTADQNDPNSGQLYTQYQQLQSRIQITSQQINEEYQSLIATQISKAYGEIYQAANDIAADQGYAFVFATRADGKLIQTDTITGITQEILARPLVTPPSGVDLTEQVRVKLGYPEESAEVYDAAGEVDPSATTQTESGDDESGDDQPENDDE